MDITSHNWVLRQDNVHNDKRWSIYKVDTIGGESFVGYESSLSAAKRTARRMANTEVDRVKIEGPHHNEEMPAYEL